MPIRIKQLTSRSRIYEYTNSNGGCEDNVNNVTIIFELQYLVRYNFLFKRRSKWITVYTIKDCIPIKEYSLIDLEEKVIKGHKQMRIYF